MTEFEQLIAQRDELNRRIEALQNKRYTVGNVKFEKRDSSYMIWVVGVSVKDRWRYIVKEKTEEQAINTLKSLTQELNELLKMIEEDNNGEL